MINHIISVLTTLRDRKRVCCANITFMDVEIFKLLKTAVFDFEPCKEWSFGSTLHGNTRIIIYANYNCLWIAWQINTTINLNFFEQLLTMSFPFSFRIWPNVEKRNNRNMQQRWKNFSLSWILGSKMKFVSKILQMVKISYYLCLPRYNSMPFNFKNGIRMSVLQYGHDFNHE